MISGGLSGSETVNLDDIDMDMVKAESDLYLNATTFGSAVIVAAALVGISVYGDTSLGATLSYLLMEFEASINILKTEYERYKQSKLYQEYLDGNEESGIEFYNNTRSEQVKTACIALGYLADLVFMSADGLITKKLEEKTARKALEKNAADEVTEQLLKEQDEWAIQYAEIEATREAEKKAAENAGKEFAEDASEKTAKEVIEEEILNVERTISENCTEIEIKTSLQKTADDAAIVYNKKYNPVKRAQKKGFIDVKETANGGISFEGSPYIYKNDGNDIIVNITATGNRSKDFNIANELSGLEETPEGYVWHHLDNYNVNDNSITLELVSQDAHNASKPHSGGCAQYDAVHGPTYNPIKKGND